MGNKNDEATDQRFVVKVAWVAHRDASPETGARARHLMEQLLPEHLFEMTDRLPDIILFMSGGSERRAISMIQPGHPVLLLSIRGNNAYAAATEVMAWMVNNKYVALLSDAMDARETGLIDRWRRTIAVWSHLSGKKAGLIGSVADWLVASAVPAEKLWHTFEVTLEEIPWDTMPDYEKVEPDNTLMKRFNGRNVPGLADSSKILALLRQTVDRKGLSAIAVECFSLVQQKKISACLALAQLNSEGVVAACEGDLASMAGMMLLGTLADSVPWMANTTRVTENTLILSHCTVPFDLVGDITLPTHYETDCSLAVRGTVVAADVTVFRLSGSLDKAFIAEGKVTGNPRMADACRTQTEIKLTPEALTLLREQPLGNHLLMAPGKYAASLRLACQYKGINIL